MEENTAKGTNKKKNYKTNQPEGTPSIPELLKEILIQSNQTHSAWLCHPKVSHIRSTSTSFGLGDLTWGCGYRNLQMLFSNLIHRPNYQIHLSNHPLLLTSSSSSSSSHSQHNNIPSILTWQSIIEDAWKSGFDPDGATHFSNSLIGKKNWIGTTEVYVALNRLGVRCQIVDFPHPTGPNGQHIKLMKWVEDYFQSDLNEINDNEENEQVKKSKIKLTNKFPLYFQHKGHSRTIIGIEIDSNLEYHLLILDPARSISRLLKKEADRKSTPLVSSKKGDKSSQVIIDSSGPTSTSSLSLSSLIIKEKSKETDSKSTSFFLKLPKSKPYSSKILNYHRSNLKKLSQHAQYQILYIREDLGPLFPFEIDAVEQQPKYHNIQSIRIT